MKPTERARLTTALRDHVAKIATDLRAKMCAPGATRTRAQQLHADEQVAEDFDVWTDLLSRRAAVLWLLKSVYVRVLEDRGLLAPGRLLDQEAQHLFERLAPQLGETAFLRWVYRDLASSCGGLPELFCPQPAEIAFPSDEVSRALIAFWRHRDADTGGHWSFAEERFEGELMGDLYQDLDPVVKDRFALCQTPDFVRAFILDRTLTPAIETFGADQVRLLDPSCGSGHFLIDGLKRLVAATAAKHADWECGKVVAHALDRVVGIDLNDYACALARTRLVMTAAELAGVTTLADAAQFHPHVYWADGLEQVERAESKREVQADLFVEVEERPRATLTRSDVRAALKKVFASKFHAVVANPPYIPERDNSRKAYHKEKVGSRPRYQSAFKQYHLSSPFFERCFQLSVADGFVGAIIDDQFMKRDYGRPLIERVLAGLDLQLVVDTSHIRIPHHGTPTALLFARNRSPASSAVRTLMGKRGEMDPSVDPACGHIWPSILAGWNKPGFNNDFLSVVDVMRDALAKHPWSLQGGVAFALKSRLERAADARLEAVVELPIGRAARVALEEAFTTEGERGARRRCLTIAHCRMHFRGAGLRDWQARSSELIWFPYSLPDGRLVVDESDEGWRRDLRSLWNQRSALAARATFQGIMADAGLQWFEYMQFTKSLVRSGIQIAYANIASHNHFVLVRAREVFASTAPVVKLPDSAPEDDYYWLLGLLNSSVLAFWMRQVFQDKGAGGIGGGYHAETWSRRIVYDATKLRLAPVVHSAEVDQYARALSDLGERRSARTAGSILASTRWTDAVDLQAALKQRREDDLADLYQMVGLQEELDWLCYRLYGIPGCADGPVTPARDVQPVAPPVLPWLLELAQRDQEFRSRRGENPTEPPTAWFSRHRWDPSQNEEWRGGLAPPAQRVVEQRRALIKTHEELRELERATYKRRWFRPDYAAEEADAQWEWLATSIEDSLSVRNAATPSDRIAGLLQGDQRVQAVAECMTGRRDFSLEQLIADLLQRTAVPNHALHLYKPSGQGKLQVWNRAWGEQRKQDAGEPADLTPPPKFSKENYLRPEFFEARGELGVAKERFIAFTEVPGRADVGTLYGWAGWTPLQRLKAVLAIDEELEDGGVPLADRIALLDSAWRLVPDLAREDAAAATRLKAELQSLVGPDGPSRELIEDWKKRFPPPNTRASRAKRTAAVRQEEKVESGESDES